MQNRRSFLRSAVAGSSLFPAIVNQVSGQARDPLAARCAPTAPKTKNVIFLFMSGGVSHVDTFDPKPALDRDHAKSIQLDHPETKARDDYKQLFLKRPQWRFQRYGESGTAVSSLFPNVGGCVDDITLIRSMTTGHSNHYNATLGIHTGSYNFARPSLGSWLSYGLGSPNSNLPGFVVIAPKQTYAGTQVYANDFLPAMHQGTLVVPGANPIDNIAPRVPIENQRIELEALRALDRGRIQISDSDPALEARIRSFETAFGMQMAVPDVFDFSSETKATFSAYGLSSDQTTGFGWQCLAARRLIERGVRFVELIDVGSSNNWDAHGDMQTHVALARNVDQPIAALLKDLKQRGLLDETLVVWTSEFGRTPFNNSPDAKGREHHPWAFSSWMAGAGLKSGIVHGATDEYGLRVAENPVDVHDLHATILHLMGFDHEKFTYRHAGRDYRLTDVHGRVVTEILG